MMDINFTADIINVISNFKETKMKVDCKVINTNRNLILKKEFLFSGRNGYKFFDPAHEGKISQSG